MPPIGQTLREARLRRRIDIAEVEQATKIRSKYLRALEAEEFDRLPGATFVRTFLRTYAEYLGLDSQLLVEEYRTTHEAPAEDDVQALAPPPPSPSRPRAREGRRRPQGGPAIGRGTTIAAAIVAILALLLVIGLLGSDGEDEGPDRPANAGGDRQSQRGKGSGGGSAEEASDVVALRVEPAAETYLCIENGEGDELVDTNVTAPEEVEGKTLRVLFGNTLAVEATANGEPIELAESPDPVGIEVTPDGDEELAEGEFPCQ